MVKIEKGVFDTGPFLHLHEIEALAVAEIVQLKYISQEVKEELEHYEIPLHSIKKILTPLLSLQYKNIAKILTEQYELELGESTAIALAQQEKISLFFTDDLDAREAAKKFHLEVHGTLGLLLRALREKQITQEEALEIVKRISTESSLFLTSDLVNWINKEIKMYKAKR